MIGYISTGTGAALLLALAFAARSIPRFGPRRWIPPAWALAVCTIALVLLMRWYQDEFYALYQMFRDPDYAARPGLRASPRAVAALSIAVATVAVTAAIALDLARTSFGARCPRCMHRILDAQQCCPECGASKLGGADAAGSWLDMTAVRYPAAAFLLQACALLIPTATFVALAVAFLPTVEARSVAVHRPVLTIDGSPALCHAWVSADATGLRVPGLGEMAAQLELERSIKVRFSAERVTDTPRPRPQASPGGLAHFEDVVIEARLRSADDYRAFQLRLESELLPNIDRSEALQYVEMLLHQFMGVPRADIPATPTLGVESPASDSSAPARESTVFQNGLRRLGHRTGWPGDYDSGYLQAQRPSIYQTLLLPMAVGLIAAAAMYFQRSGKRVSAAGGSR